MTPDDIAKTIRELIREQSGQKDISSIKDDSHLINDLGMDSIDMIELIMSLEDAFDTEIQGDDTLFTIPTVAEVIAYMQTQVTTVKK